MKTKSKTSKGGDAVVNKVIMILATETAGGRGGCVSSCLRYRRSRWRSTMRLAILCLLLAAVPVLSQTNASSLQGVSEPPELSGKPRKFTPPSEAERQLNEIMGQLKDGEHSALPKLSRFIADHPDYTDAYLARAIYKGCFLNSEDLASFSADVNAAISRSPNSKKTFNKADYYPLLGKIAFASGHYREAMDDLEKAIKEDPDGPSIFNNAGRPEPEKTSNFCTWNLTDLDTLIARFPKDYRGRLFRGLYFFTKRISKEQYSATAMQEFQNAALLNPSSPLPHYFVGELYMDSQWKLEVRETAIRNAIQAQTEAIQKDAKFLPAYVQRASCYVSLEQYPHALKDYDRILELDPENTMAYFNRAMARLDSAQYRAAVVDLSEAIRRQGEDDLLLSAPYELRGDAYVQLGDYRKAVADYSKALERLLASDSLRMNLKQIRTLYPEYDAVSDEKLIRKINVLFGPEFEYDVLEQRLTKENRKWQNDFSQKTLYEKRGDAYLKAEDFQRGVLDFTRIYKGIPGYAESTDRWRLLRMSGEEAYYLDVKSAEFSSADAHLWIKVVRKNATQTVGYEMDCKTRRLNTTSIKESSGENSGWQRIIPDTIGEQFYNGACSSGG